MSNIMKTQKSKKKWHLLVTTLSVLFGLLLILVISGVTHADSYGNHAYSQVYATDIFGIHMAWVNNNWQYFATYNNGDFQLNTNTKLVTNSGGVWPDGGSITGTSSHESSTDLSSSVDYSLNSAVGQHLTGTLVNQMEYVGNGQYVNYVYIYGTGYYQSGVGGIPIDFDVTFDA
ncbi:MAG: hypothetical protein LVQ96_06600 [Thermoplasmatales archaeon]|nr:hypothetical protein [Thermoplasmatales archaeon]